MAKSHASLLSPNYDMQMVEAAHVRQTAGACVEFLRKQLDDDWTAAVPDLDMTVVEVIAHAAEVCLWYAIDLAAGGKDLGVVEHRVKSDGSPVDVVDALWSYASVVASVVETSPARARGFHPMGSADPSGFAAMACDEMLIHADDAARGLGIVFQPAPALAEPVLHRLFPWVNDVSDPWEMLRWSNGRVALVDQPRLSDWAWHCAPAAEWDGSVAVRPPN